MMRKSCEHCPHSSRPEENAVLALLPRGESRRAARRPDEGRHQGIYLLCTLFVISMAGCQAYQVGAPTLHRFDINTVHVSVFESDSYRRFLGQRLTESVTKEIELNTPYRLATADVADSFITGRILRDRKRVLVESINDDPRDIQFGLRVEVNWTDRSGVPLMQRQVLRIDRDVDFIPEGGQSITTAQQEVINRVARDIVNQMEVPW